MIAALDMGRRQGTVTRHRGYWRARIVVNGKRESLGLWPTQQAAEEAIAAALKQTGSDGALTLRRWGTEYLDARELDGYHRNVKDDRSRWNARVMSAPFADDPIDTITTEAIIDWVRDMIRERERTTVQNALNLLRVALEEAVQARKLKGANPARPVRVPKKAKKEDGWSWLTVQEIERLLTARPVKDTFTDLTIDRIETQRCILTVAIYTGLREGELWGLRWKDVVLDGNMPRVHVRRSYTQPTKGGRTREVPLLQPAIDALRAHKQRHPGILDALVFPADREDPTQCHGDGYDAQIKTWLKAAGILRRVRFHDLRHTCGSHLVQGSWGRAWRLEEVKAWLGHEDIKTTQRYAHLSSEGLHALAAETRVTTQVTGHKKGPRKLT